MTRREFFADVQLADTGQVLHSTGPHRSIRDAWGAADAWISVWLETHNPAPEEESR